MIFILQSDDQMISMQRQVKTNQRDDDDDDDDTDDYGNESSGRLMITVFSSR